MAARLEALLPRLSEWDRRLALAAEAHSWWYGGIAAVHRATGVARETIMQGLSELAQPTGLLTCSARQRFHIVRRARGGLFSFGWIPYCRGSFPLPLRPGRRMVPSRSSYGSCASRRRPRHRLRPLQQTRGVISTVSGEVELSYCGGGRRSPRSIRLPLISGILAAILVMSNSR